jgi:two-component system cell cycle sensor histidine kinase/response regulator CckA
LNRALIVDDKADNRYLLRALLTGHGWSVDEAQHGAEALEMALGDPPQLLITDLLMPVMDGYTLLRRWKTDERLCRVPVVVYTATYTSPEDERLALELGADAFLLKPTEPEVFLSRIHSVVAAAARGEVRASSPQLVQEQAALRHYNEALIRKLEGKSEELERANQELRQREQELRAAAEFNQAALDALPQHLCVLDHRGVILATNRAWQRFAEANGGRLEAVGVGVDYLAVCDTSAASGLHAAADFAHQLRRVLSGEISGFATDYPCHAPTESRWFNARVSRFESGGTLRVVITHENISPRVVAEEALRESEGRFRRLAENAPDLIFRYELTPEPHFTYVSPAATEITGYSPQDHYADPNLGQRLVHPDDRGQLEPWLRGEASSEPLTLRWVRRDGQVIWTEQRNVVLRDPGGRPVAIEGIARDITERKRVDDALRRLNRTYAMLSAVNELIVRARDPQELLLRACQIAVERGGLPLAWVGQLAGGPASERLQLVAHAGADARTVAGIERILGEDPDGCVLTLRALSTGAHQVAHDIATEPEGTSWRASALGLGFRSMIALPLTVGGRPVGTFNLYASEPGFFDADEVHLLDELALDLGFALEALANERQRLRAEEELRASELRFRELAETLEEVFWIADAERQRFLYLSPGFERVFGRNPQEVSETPDRWLELVHPEDRPRVDAAIGACRQSGHYDEEYRIVRPDQRQRILRDRAYPVRDAHGRIERMVGVARDITEQRLLEDQLRQAQKLEAVGRLAGGVAHDFNNLLAVMMLQTELLLGGNLDPVTVRAGLGEIRAATERAASLTRQLLLFSRRQVLQRRDLDLNEVVTNIATMLRRVIGEDIQLQLHLHPAPLRLHADSGMLDQVLMNLAVNARDAMPRGGQLLVETAAATAEEIAARPPSETSARGYARLRVSDTGTGISPELLPHVFEPFFTTKEAGHGTGLGLATVFGIVRQHGGWIDARSAPGEGAAFTIFLPTTSQPAVQRLGDQEAAPPGGEETILLVEDAAEVRQVTRMVLEDNGYRIVEAADGREALTLWPQHRDSIRLLLTDLVLPGGLTGRELAERLLADQPSLRVLLTSGYSEEIAGRDLALGRGQGFLQKPANSRSLLAAVRRCLDG